MFDQIEAALCELKTQGEMYMATVDQLIDEIRGQRTKVAGLNTLMDGMRDKIKDLVSQSGNVPADLQAKIDQAFDEAKQESAAIDEAITENTPADTGGAPQIPQV